MKTRIMLRGKNCRMIGVGVSEQFVLSGKFNAESLDEFLKNTEERTRFITISYELGRSFLAYAYTSEDKSEFPVLQLWVPESLYEISENKAKLVEGLDSQENKGLASELLKDQNCDLSVDWKALKSKIDYLKSVKKLQDHIQRGDIYETNFCQEFSAENVDVENGIAVFQKLDELTNAPFSVYYESDNWLIASASPERFLLKENGRLISQPIKGTAPRNSDKTIDEANKKALAESEKDKAENVMIVDLVRNDLSRVAAKNSVKVDELFGIHTFPTVHQMISTVSCELRDNVRFSNILEATFPMGSMTGAPKMSAVKLSDRYEGFSRGIYSGSIGYIAPFEASFDLNVMIRTLVYSKSQKRLSCAVGGAITIASDPEGEYEECKTKVGRILEIFGTCQW